MDLEKLKAAVMEETAQALLDKLGFVPEQDSVEWEEEYRRHFARVKARLASAPPAAAKAAPGAKPDGAGAAPGAAAGPALGGAPADARWAATIRAQRLKEIENDELRLFLAGAWLAAKDWLETREMPAPAFRRIIEAQFAAHRQRLQRQAAAASEAARVKADAAAALFARRSAAGVTARGLVELIDLSTRVKPAPIGVKLAELEWDQRRVRVFETANPAILQVLESGPRGRNDYGIERDEGLVADLKLFAETEVG
jgi:hypothetical protein